MKHIPRHPVSATDRISNQQLVAYGLGGLIPIALFNIAGQLMGLIGNIGLGLSAFWLGVVLIIPRLWDAVSDPVMGHFSDNIRTRWGRRRPFLLMGGIAVALSFVLMWWVPKGPAIEAWFGSEAAYEWFQLGYILVFLLIFFTACTIFEIPHGALGMEMSKDPHERTRLFGAKSFWGNLFAMGTPWLFALANLDFFKGTGGNEADGMRWVSMLIAVVLIPLSIWWFVVCKEPGFERVQKQKKEGFWHNMKVAVKNQTFRRLVVIIFALAMGFNFVGLLNYYITIFYLYGGDKAAAGPLLGINGTIWAVTGLLAVFPLNWVGRSLGKKWTLALAIGLMSLAQLSKIVCYNPSSPYLVIIPTVLLSAGMLMFFTMGSSMLGDICDEDDLATGTRSEGSYYSVYWWFIKLGTAFASFVTGSLIVLSQFDEKQTKGVDELEGAVKKAQEQFEKENRESASGQLEQAKKISSELIAHFSEKGDAFPHSRDHYDLLIEQTQSVNHQLDHMLGSQTEDPVSAASFVGLTDQIEPITQQTPTALLRLRIFEIGLPLVLCVVSFWLLRFYPLTDKRSYEVKHLLEERNKLGEEEE
ncbi:MFS transporter [Verrucomicrobiaceae bacterium N1E253]|uniref:MFS transporter n=1 Tax=Oceaniferula marina TaxID=2748318 RepID=A0A851G995_9BACT|nr:MFS transporter [Oceaniferula marina]NWK54183.1 MFS transporter [Oceaniferula marina]